MFMDSLVSRVYLFLFATPVMYVVMMLISKIDAPVAALASVAYILPFVGASWFFIGQAKPWKLFLFDVLPQGLGTVAGVVLIQFFPEPIVFVLSLLAFNLAAVVLGAVGALSGTGHPPKADLHLIHAIGRLRDQKYGVIAAGTGSLNSNLPMLAVNQVVAAALPQYALADKLFRFAVAGFGPVLQVIQGWIPEAGPARSSHRIRTVAGLAPIVGLLAGLLLALLTPWASPLFSGGVIIIDYSLSIPFGLILAGVIVAQVVGLACLIPLGRGAALAKSTAIGAAVNVPLMFALGIAFGAPGVAWAVALAELVVAGYQIMVVRDSLRHVVQPPIPSAEAH
ncbi:polysaccharide biosynthesis C-terminal domain-containing protein [Pseudarthrobacter sp. MDT3-1]|uniref:polysaccharide biosynthesis C-terminal domain-containing protein n=1 Tax=Pseudarthrobacter raffinosi TaxID=2953651 RepID=UPI00208F9ED3|nr:polysaccharide biosynthesis C-terminal domain-containing protein [Pseudarthrobacter sp. MDT3-28]MCO4237893.1 polysaccharide biosynthesis C-terminal domain-containing protein [Pseudarthrobacter sp. MDT3-28]